MSAQSEMLTPVTYSRGAPAVWSSHTGRAIFRFVRSYPLGALSACVLVAFGLVAIFAPIVAPYDPLLQNLPNHLKGPSIDYPLGTDNFGRDVWSRIVFGGRVSLFVGFFAVVPATILGVILGVTSAYVRGKVDLIMQRVVDTLLGFPPLVLAMVMVIGLGPSMNNVTIAIGILLIPPAIRLSRSAALSVSQESYVEAARSIGASRMRVVMRHILPNSLRPVFVGATGALATAILAEAALSFLGLGVPPPAPSWGGMLADSIQQGRLQSAPWLGIFPGLALTMAVFSFALLGDALSDALDPRLRSR